LKISTFTIFSILVFVSCSNLNNNYSNNIVARVGENFLYKNDLPDYISEDDSIIKVLNYIESWAKEKVLYDLSIINLSQSKKGEIDELVDNYKVDLYINSYKDLIVNSRIDSLVTEEQVESFYSTNLNNFRLNENLIKYRYIKVPDDNVNINRIRRYIFRISQQDRYFLDSLNFQFAELNLNDTTWFTERDVISSIDFINQNNKSQYLITKRLFSVEELNFTNFFIVEDILKSGNIPPMSYLYDRIKSTIINQRKIDLLKSLNNEILKDALKSRKYEVYN
tara:strand:- start:3278 stop:4117 length:840 start_codon:yes stop_codon:yes gene_type:complete